MSSDEPHITINGQVLTTGQALAIRVAITTFHAEMSEPNALGDDEHGRFMTEHYRDRLSEVLHLVIAPSDSGKDNVAGSEPGEGNNG